MQLPGDVAVIKTFEVFLVWVIQFDEMPRVGHTDASQDLFLLLLPRFVFHNQISNFASETKKKKNT